LHIQKAFVSCSGFSMARGMTEKHFDEAQLKRKAISSSTQIFALIDSSKFGKEDLTSFASAGLITHLFTDDGIALEWVACLEQAGMAFTVCRGDAENSR
jgi:DeoR family transcriptional regulator, fructose operon transcriptional repressor